ncbi:MAG: cytidylate kinase family protein [Spirochaetota bacterium]|nr:cytidylate kinase family protein [Spirochaetota bacterium]
MYCIKTGQELRVAISGKSGCGNTTISGLLAKTLHIRLINYTFRSLSEENGLSLNQIIENAKTDDSYDLLVDRRQVELAKKESCVLGSRLAIWMLSSADLKVYLVADEEVRAKRIQEREGGSLQDIIDFTRMRDSEDRERYKRLYSIDNNDFSFADLIIDVSKKSPEEILLEILNELEKRSLIDCTPIKNSKN